MTNIQLYTQISSLPANLKKEASDFINSLIKKSNQKPKAKDRIPGKAKGLIVIKDNFDNPIPGFEEYIK